MGRSRIRKWLSNRYWPARRRWIGFRRAFAEALSTGTKESRREALWYALAAVGRAVVRVRTKNGIFSVSTSDQVLGRHLFISGDYEYDRFELLMRLLDEARFFSGGEKIFVDIGANIGTKTIYALRSQRFTHAVCFEPEPGNFRLLKRNISANGYRDRCTLHPIALGPTDGTMTLELSDDNYGDHRLRFNDARGSEHYKEHLRTTSEVAVRQLDRMAGDLSPADCLLKIDAQGAEGSILSCGERFLSGCPAAFCEFWPYGLNRTDTMPLYQSILQAHFSSFYDFREQDVEKRPIGDLPLLVDRYRGKTSTDLLLLK